MTTANLETMKCQAELERTWKTRTPERIREDQIAKMIEIKERNK